MSGAGGRAFRREYSKLGLEKGHTRGPSRVRALQIRLLQARENAVHSPRLRNLLHGGAWKGLFR